MKKKFVAALFLLPLFFGGCESKQTGNVSELMRYDWQAEFDNGGEMRLSFKGERATLTLQNGGEQETIDGKVIADDTSFVIFDREISQNYGFEYVPRGEKLDLTFEGNTIELTAIY